MQIIITTLADVLKQVCCFSAMPWVHLAQTSLHDLCADRRGPDSAACTAPMAIRRRGQDVTVSVALDTPGRRPAILAIDHNSSSSWMARHWQGVRRADSWGCEERAGATSSSDDLQVT